MLLFDIHPSAMGIPYSDLVKVTLQIRINANVGHNGNDRIGSNREVSQANTSNRSNRNGHFGGRR